MRGLLLSRLKQAALVAFGVITVVFFLFAVLPGDPARMMMGQQEDSEQMKRIYARYGFDKPILKQYLYYLNDLSPLSIHPPEGFGSYDESKYGGIVFFKPFDWSLVLKAPYLRESFQQKDRPVSNILANVLPNTIVLAVASIIIALFLGIFMGLAAAHWQGTWIDKALVVFSSLGMSVPSFFSAIIIAWLFGFVWHSWTGLEMNGNLYVLDDYGESLHRQWRNLILPALTLGIRPLGVVTQLTRGSVLEVLHLDYIRTARSKGLTESRILFRHALPNALIPVVTAVSGWFASMLAGAVFVEYIFGWNGLGKQIVEALNLLDLPVVMGAVLVTGILFVFINLMVDLLYALIDPRMRTDS